jgi:hypothetical protein
VGFRLEHWYNQTGVKIMQAASGQAAAPLSSVMNSRRLNSPNCIRTPPAKAVLQHIEWAGMSQRVSER